MNLGGIFKFRRFCQRKESCDRTLFRHSWNLSMRPLRQKHRTHKISRQGDRCQYHHYRHLLMNSMSGHEMSDARVLFVFEICSYLRKNHKICQQYQKILPDKKICWYVSHHSRVNVTRNQTMNRRDRSRCGMIAFPCSQYDDIRSH